MEMIDQLRYDITKYPDVFWLKNPLDEPLLERAKALWNPPHDLISLWREFGTGDMFESEVILRPFAESSSVEFITERERQKGLPQTVFAFHYGIFVSGFESERFLIFDTSSYELLGEFESLDEWYIKLIRGSWWERYGMARQLR
jgi:hypothetical protein